MANLAKRQSTAIERVLSEIPDKSRTRQNLRYAKHKTREHEKVELIGSSLVALLCPLAEQSQLQMNQTIQIQKRPAVRHDQAATKLRSPSEGQR